MGPWKKYSAGLWSPACKSLEASEVEALRTVCERAGIENRRGLRVLDMGCGWGSFTLFCATTYPDVSITSVSNSASQREYIMAEAARRGLSNITVVTADINVFDGAGRNFDRVVSVEMLEHVKNYEAVFSRVSSWMAPGGRFFIHIFTHKTTPFHYVDGWMAENFFTGGQMPSHDLLTYFQRDVTLVNSWWINGSHYEKTSNAWLAKIDAERPAARAILEAGHGKAAATRELVKWRLFFIAVAELFGFDRGNEWGVSHYVFEKAIRA
jgi:cyclopropane-fatty-acyl-phospholipid synthase